MRSPKPNRVKRRGVAERLDLYAVCLIGWDGPRPRTFGDNRGIWPVKIAVSKKEVTAAARTDLESPHVGVIVLEYVLVPSEAHAKRLKEKLDEVLLGEQEGQQNDSLRHKWRDVIGLFDDGDDHQRAMWWGIVVEEARRLLRHGATEFTIYGAPEDVPDDQMPGYGDD